MDILLIVACLYMAYSNITSLAEVPFAEWGMAQYAMVVLTVALVAVGGLKGWQFYKKKKAAADAPPPEEEAKAEAPVVEATTAPVRAEAPPIEEANPEDLEDWEIEAADFNYTLVELPKDEK